LEQKDLKKRLLALDSKMNGGIKLNKLIITTILMLLIILVGCSDSHKTQQNQGVINNPISNREIIWSTLPEPSAIVIYNQGKSQTVKTTDPEYNALAKEINTLVKNSNLPQADVYKLFLTDGDISKYRNQSGVELIYSTPINLNIRSVNKTVLRLFIYCGRGPMLFLGTSGSSSYEGGPPAISNTDNLKKLIENY
jgi:hypothetical protein